MDAEQAERIANALERIAQALEKDGGLGTKTERREHRIRPEEIAEWKRLREQGESYTFIAHRAGRTPDVIRKALDYRAHLYSELI